MIRHMKAVHKTLQVSLWLCFGVFAGKQALAQTPGPSLNLYGSSGLIDMPGAEHQEDGDLSMTLSGYSGSPRGTLTFQITPRFSGSFRYGSVTGYNNDGTTRYDRSFDVRFRVLEESRFLPAVSIGLQDFAGTGLYSAEYIVATKQLFPGLKATAGVGWGRLGGRQGFIQRTVNIGNGGVPDVGNWFRGPRALFGGLEWQTPLEGLSIKAEYSSDGYVHEVNRNIFTLKTPYNFGAEYKVNKTLTLGAYYLHGSQFALKASLSFNPRKPPAPSGLEPAPQPVFGRPELKPGEQFATNWLHQPGINATLQGQVQKIFDVDKLKLDGLQVDGTSATVYLRNDTYIAQAEAIGRAARSMSRSLPASIETFRIVLVREGVPVSEIRLNRSDLERLEYDPQGAEKLLARARIESAPARAPKGLEYADGLYPRFKWSLTPSVRTSFFDPDAPIRIDLGVRARARYDLAPGLSVSGSLNQPLVGNLDKIGRGGGGNPAVPRVRSFAAEYYKQGEPALERLTGDYLFKLRPDIYGRVSVGYLENMFGGVSGEVLWKPDNRNFALGAELNYVRQRDFDQRFGFRDYSVLTGHVSAYWNWNNGFTAQIDAGRYLAGDIGATFTLNRIFNNGWKVGAFFTLTDMPFSDFGEGSFDKGIIFSMPLNWGIGTATRQTVNTVIRPLTRDGGARLNIENRLYPLITAADNRAVKSTWGRVWR